LVANAVRLHTPYCPKMSVRKRLSQPREFPRQIGKDFKVPTRQQGPQRRPVEADVRKLLALEMERTSMKQRLGLWNLCEVEGRFWMSLKETSSVFFRVALWCCGFAVIAERVFSICKLVLALNYSTIDF